MYETQDPNLKDWSWKEIWANIIDIGAFNKFWNLENNFVNYDIHENEFL